jgi:hypothetical protein
MEDDDDDDDDFAVNMDSDEVLSCLALPCLVSSRLV